MKRIFIVLAILFLTAVNAFSTTLPPELTEYIRQQVPNVSIRFDGLVMYPDKTIYLPLIPALPNTVDKVVPTYTYPANSDLKKKAEIIVFNNNYVLLKVIKEKNGVTVSKATNYPITVKTGVLPQDLLVPKGLYVPESLEGILGDLKVPVGERPELASKKVEETIIDESTQFLDKKIPVTVPKIEALKNKLYFVSNYDSNFLRVINSNDTQPLYSLKLDSIPRSITSTPDDKYLLVTTAGKNFVDIVDIQREEIARQIDLNVEPSEAIVDSKNNIAYVAAKNDESMFIIDLKTMELKQKILLKGYPENLSITEDGSKLVYQDRNTTRLYVVLIPKDYTTLPLINVSNVSKIIANNNVIYAISRTENKLYVISYPSDTNALADRIGDPVFFTSIFNPVNKQIPSPVENLILAKKDITEKPVDMVAYNDKLYILGAKQNQLSVYDTATNNVINVVDLPMSGFSKQLTMVPDTNYVVITNAFEEKYIIFNLDNLSTIQQIPVNTKINNLIILKKMPYSVQDKKKDNL